MARAYQVNLKSEAASDLEAIYLQIHRDSPQNASAMIDKLVDAISSLSAFPYRYAVRQKRRNPARTVRALIVWPYLAYFRVDERVDLVTVLTIRHGARRQPKRFK